jgi:hypothetical protein
VMIRRLPPNKNLSHEAKTSSPRWNTPSLVGESKLRNTREVWAKRKKKKTS